MKKILLFFDLVLSRLVGYGSGSNSIDKEIRLSKRFIKDGKVFIDVGGNKGLFTECLLKNYNVEEIHVFEPSKLNVEILNSKFGKNDKIKINNFGLSNENQSAVLYSNEEGSGLASLSKRKLDHFGISFETSESINLKRFDQYWLDEISLDYIDLLKIDVEGHELSVLEGLGEKIFNVKVIQFEFGGCNIDTRTYFQDFWYFFKNKNFDLYRQSPIGLFEVKEYKETLERFQTSNYVCVNNRFF
jgi:FkbM family methyltransferase